MLLIFRNEKGSVALAVMLFLAISLAFFADATKIMRLRILEKSWNAISTTTEDTGDHQTKSKAPTSLCALAEAADIGESWPCD